MSRKDYNMGCYAVNRAQNKGEFANKLVIIGTLKNHDFWCVDSPMN